MRDPLIVNNEGLVWAAKVTSRMLKGLVFFFILIICLEDVSSAVSMFSYLEVVSVEFIIDYFSNL